ncbi:translocation/assembly module TamB [Paraflavitalea sp. CAU 1676]|uniref:translocation/assembly module TamB domain-containing protein n=1 Tax=Paraflavitalea sp. CAU 1676 TaxID=3032598 RepID=UPI0023DA98A6|nr:translocation/assembly module TamB [Paraflavitalea sp. CAU 1676]MDF2191557.1 translocation/assembly module TamB domain-containing protein [Paraflavitalea sp. CAU 1676]
MKQPTNVPAILKKIGRILLKTFLIILGILILLVLVIQTPPVQHFIRGKAVSWLQKKLQTRVDVSRLYIGFPKKIVLEGIYLEDRQKDTLFYGGSIKVDLNLWKLIKSEVLVQEISLENITANVKRTLPDTTFNFQFIIDAFASKEPAVPSTDTSSLKMSIDRVVLDKFSARYLDVVNGSDMKVYIGHFDTRIDRFDPAHAAYSVPSTELRGLRASIYQRKPIVTPESPATDKAEAAAGPDMQLQFKEIELEDCQLDYGNDESALYANLTVGDLLLHMQELDLTRQLIRLDEVTLNNTTAAIRFGKKPAAKVVVKEVKQEVQAQAEAGWRVTVNKVALEKNAFRMDDDNTPKAKTGMDYAHLDLRELHFAADDIRYSSDTISGRIAEGSFTERSGFTLQKLQTNFQYTAKGAYLHDLLVQTPGTRLERSIDVAYPSLDALQKDIGQLRLDMDIRDSKVQVKDILTFAPFLAEQPAFANPQSTWQLHSQVSGSVSDLRIGSLRIKGMQQTNLELAGNIKGLPDMKKLQANLAIKDISSSARDVERLLPKGSIPENITIPSQFNLSGKLNGTEKKLYADLLLNTTLGTATVKGTVQNPADSINIGYDLALTAQSFDLKKLLKQPDLGLLTMNVTAKGRGRVVKTMDATVDGLIAVADYKGYRYHDFKLNGHIRQQVFEIKAAIQNEPIHVELDASGSLAGAYPAIKLHAVVDSVKTLPLHLTTDNIIYRGNIDADFPLLNIDSLEGRLLVTKNLLVMGDRRIETDTLEVVANLSDSGQVIDLRSEVLTAKLWGQYHLTELGTVMQRSMNKYFSNAPDSLTGLPPYDFRVNATLVKGPLLQGFAPDLKQLEPVLLNGHFTSNGGINATLKAPLVVYGTNEISNAQLTANTEGNSLQALVGFDAYRNGESLVVYETRLRAALADNKINFALHTKDVNGKDKYHLEGLLAQPARSVYEFSLRPDSLMLNYQEWVAGNDNKIRIDSTNITADKFWLSYMDQRLSIQTRTDQPGQPLGVGFDRFRIGTLVSFIQKDSLIADGELNGAISFTNIMKEPVFAGDLTIKNVSMSKDTLGDIHAIVNNETPNNYAADITLTGHGNDIGIKGVYKMEEVSSFDFDVAIRTLQLKSLQAASMGSIKSASGTATGQFALKGTIDKPSINGELTFNKAIVVPTAIGSPLKIDQTGIKITDEGVVFNEFTIRDSANNTATLDGTAYTTNFTNYKFDLVFNARNFQALNSTAKENELYYGDLYFNSRLNIKGTELHPIVDGSLKVNEKTKLTVVMPQEDPGVQDREGVVRFVDKDAVPNDSLWQGSGLDSLNTANIRDYDINVNITIDKEAELNMIVDAANGDFLQVKGEANLNGGIDPSGKVTMTGTYELQQGSYQLALNFLKRKFDIQKGSRIIWQGEPTEAEVDITAIYEANTSPIDLVGSQLGSETSTADRNKYRQRLPFLVYLKMEDKLLKPKLTFDIRLPEDRSLGVDKGIVETTNTKLEQLRQQPGEMNKQVFSLLLLNRFIQDDPFATGNSALTPESFARQSVSKLLTEQLNNLAAGLVQGVDINFDVQSQEDFTTGQAENRTELNVEVSKRLLNDRLKVTVGSNFELEGAENTNRQSNNIGADVRIDYELSRDGRYMLRAYRKNEYEGILEGYIIETGVGLVITIDYNRFREIFESAKKREARRLERQRQRQLREAKEEEVPTAPPPVTVPKTTGGR